MKFTFCEEDSRFFRRTPRHEMCYDITDISDRTGFGCISERAGRQARGLTHPLVDIHANLLPVWGLSMKNGIMNKTDKSKSRLKISG